MFSNQSRCYSLGKQIKRIMSTVVDVVKLSKSKIPNQSKTVNLWGLSFIGDQGGSANLFSCI